MKARTRLRTAFQKSVLNEHKTESKIEISLQSTRNSRIISIKSKQLFIKSLEKRDQTKNPNLNTLKCVFRELILVSNGKVKTREIAIKNIKRKKFKIFV